MLSQSKLKILRSLQYSKYRAQEKKILIEGEKLVTECLQGACSSRFKLLEIFGLKSWLDENAFLLRNPELQIEQIDHKQLKQISNLKSPNQVIALMSYADGDLQMVPAADQLCLVLDRIQDPGNLGTLFRIAEWFGVEQVYLSAGTADPLNLKVLQASMGSALRINYCAVDIQKFISEYQGLIPIYGTLLDGKSIYEASLSKGGIILVGNESQGIDKGLKKYISDPLMIPRYAVDAEYPESLNAAIAAGIVLNEFRRREI